MSGEGLISMDLLDLEDDEEEDEDDDEEASYQNAIKIFLIIPFQKLSEQ